MLNNNLELFGGEARLLGGEASHTPPPVDETLKREKPVQVKATDKDQQHEDNEVQLLSVNKKMKIMRMRSMTVGSGRVTTSLQQGEVAVASNQAYGCLTPV